ncbi:MAG: site-specific integrase [Aeromicrobium sp.]|uniref:tyrosine-type recombinase/integrase n=1 Tax=Aeromicrobium sp. TaxID=1871063 RepID=UPI0039E34AC7
MAEFRQLPSGKWQATVSTPLRDAQGRPRRATRTHPLKKVVMDWAATEEAAISAGRWRDPRLAEMTLGEYRERWRTSRIADDATLAKNDSHWRTHVEPVWAGHPLKLIVREDIKTWIHRMHTSQCPRCRTYPTLTPSGTLPKHKNPAGNECGASGGDPGLGAWTIKGAVSHLSGLLASAVEEGVLPASPATKLDLPQAAPKPVFYWLKEEADAIVAQLEGSDQVAVDLDMHVGMRPGELFGLRRRYVSPAVDQIHVYGVSTRTGWRPYAKTMMSHRAVPVPPRLRDPLGDLIAGLDEDAIVFPAPEGGLWDDRNFAQRVFTPAIGAAGVRHSTPYGMRHTAASWLVQAGVPLMDVQRLLGHEKYSTTLRYAHLQPGQFNAILAAWGA